MSLPRRSRVSFARALGTVLGGGCSQRSESLEGVAAGGVAAAPPANRPHWHQCSAWGEVCYPGFPTALSGATAGTGRRLDPQAWSWPEGLAGAAPAPGWAGCTPSLEVSGGVAVPVSPPGSAPSGFLRRGADGWSPPPPRDGLCSGADPEPAAPGWAVPAWHRAQSPEVWPRSLLPLVPLVPSYEESSTPKEVPGASKEETTEAAKKKK